MEVAAFHPPPCDRRRLVSVALFLAFALAARPRLLRPGVTRHPALWSPDFPLPAKLPLRRQRRSGRLRRRHCRGFAPVVPAHRLRGHICAACLIGTDPRQGSVAWAAERGTSARSECATAGLSLRHGAAAWAAGRGMAVRSECATAGLRVPVRHRSRTSCRLCCDRARSPHHPRRPSRTLALAMSRPAAPTDLCRRSRRRCAARWRIARHAVAGSREGRLRRSRRQAGGAASEPVFHAWSPMSSSAAAPGPARRRDLRCRSPEREPPPRASCRCTQAEVRKPRCASRGAHAEVRMPRRASGGCASYAVTTSPTRQRSSSPARSGTIDPSPNGNESGTREGSRCSVIDSRLRGSP